MVKIKMHLNLRFMTLNFNRFESIIKDMYQRYQGMFLFYLKYAYYIMKCWGGHGYGYMEDFSHTGIF